MLTVAQMARGQIGGTARNQQRDLPGLASSGTGLGPAH